MAKWNIVAKDWVFTREFADSWYKYGYAPKSPTAGEINSLEIGPFLESLPQQGIDHIIIEAGIYSIVLPAPKPPKPRPKSGLEVTNATYSLDSDAAAAAAASQSENTTLGSV